jgi:hypothetical protein
VTVPTTFAVVACGKAGYTASTKAMAIKSEARIG